MKKSFTALSFYFLIISNLFSQSISEKELFRLTFKGDADAYSFIYDSNSTNYCYLYTLPDEKKTFIISNNSTSDKYDFVAGEDIRFDKEGNYYAINTNYKADYGIDNNFLIVNGKNVLNYEYIESYNTYVNNSGEFVFIFKEFDLYKLGYYSLKNGFRKSEGYESIKPLFKSNPVLYQREGDADGYRDSDFYRNEKNERGFVVISNGKAKLIFETTEIPTDYSDINESSLTMNKNNELSFIAKKEGKFYEVMGNEFVVSGNTEYDKFELISMPLIFNKINEPVYVAGDSVSEFKNIYFPVIGSKPVKVYSENQELKFITDFNFGLDNLKVNEDGSITYTGAQEIIIPAVKKNPEDTVYDEYFYKSFYVSDGTANELGYRIGQIKYSSRGDLLYSGIADLDKKEILLMLNYGESRVILNRNKFDDIYEYGFSPTDEIYYAGQIYEDLEKNIKGESSLYLGDKLIGKYDFLSYQNSNGEGSILKFDSKNNFAFVAEEKVDSFETRDFVVTNNGTLPFPSNIVTNAKMLSFISDLMYTKNDKLFFIAEMNYDPEKFQSTKEIFVDNKSLGKIYNSIKEVRYDEVLNEISFIASRGNKIYFVTVKF